MLHLEVRTCFVSLRRGLRSALCEHLQIWKFEAEVCLMIQEHFWADRLKQMLDIESVISAGLHKTAKKQS